jgi:hypothetical protein
MEHASRVWSSLEGQSSREAWGSTAPPPVQFFSQQPNGHPTMPGGSTAPPPVQFFSQQPNGHPIMPGGSTAPPPVQFFSQQPNGHPIMPGGSPPPNNPQVMSSYQTQFSVSPGSSQPRQRKKKRPRNEEQDQGAEGSRDDERRRSGVPIAPGLKLQQAMSPPALADYQMQLMLLEQQKNKVLFSERKQFPEPAVRNEEGSSGSQYIAPAPASHIRTRDYQDLISAQQGQGSRQAGNEPSEGGESLVKPEAAQGGGSRESREERPIAPAQTKGAQMGPGEWERLPDYQKQLILLEEQNRKRLSRST